MELRTSAGDDLHAKTMEQRFCTEVFSSITVKKRSADCRDCKMFNGSLHNVLSMPHTSYRPGKGYELNSAIFDVNSRLYSRTSL